MCGADDTRVLALVLLAACSLAKNIPEVTTPLGGVRGSFKTSYEGRTYSSFEGIPYARPPIGNLRFEAPQDVESWEGVWDATTTYVCPQIEDISGSRVIGEEDCLYLNIYTPGEQPSPEDKLDVVVGLHAGAFLAGSGHSFTNGHYLMDRELIFVTINYRLGVLGFLSTEDDVVPGNNGLKDQVLALKWIQKYIKYFGGNPDSVTITGFSAGGSSVHYHYLSPLSKGLFHRGYSFSGTALLPWAFQRQPLNRAKQLGALVGCVDNTSTKSLVKCLKNRPASQLIYNIKKSYALAFLPIGQFGPTVEPKSEAAFISEHPYQLLISGKINDAPWINSFTRDDGLCTAGFLLNEMDTLDERWEDLAPSIFEYSYTASDEEIPEVSKKIKEFYFGQKKISEADFDKLMKATTDREFKLDAIKATLLQNRVSKSPVYAAIYSYQSAHSFMELFFRYGKTLGVGHGDDVLLLFATVPDAKLSENDVKVKNILLDLLVSYAKTGVPEIKGVVWEPSTPSEDLTYLELNGPDDIQIKTDSHFQEALTFWDSLPLKENKRLVSVKDEL